MGDFDRVDEHIKAYNKKLRAGYGKGSIKRIGASLYLRATYPPKPGETEKKQRDLPLHLKATIQALNPALIRSIAISTDVALGRFDWRDYLPTAIEIAARSTTPATVADWIVIAKEEYFESRKESPDTLQNWMADYGYPYRKLPQDQALSIKMLSEAVLGTAPSSRSRTRMIIAAKNLAKIAGLDQEKIAGLKSSYRKREVLQRNLPSLEVIIEWHNKLPQTVQFEFAIRAAFGLRPGEGAQFCDFKNLKDEMEVSVYSTKTKESRVVYPYPKELFEIFRLGDREIIPFISKAKSIKSQTHSFADKLAKLGLPFTLYDLRHLYAWHTIKAGLDVRVAAKLMGHSVDVHCNTYNKFLTKEHFRQLRKAETEANLTC
jgi:integrase